MTKLTVSNASSVFTKLSKDSKLNPNIRKEFQKLFGYHKNQAKKSKKYNKKSNRKADNKTDKANRKADNANKDANANVDKASGNPRSKSMANQPPTAFGPLGTLQLPNTFNVHGVEWASYMPTKNINSYSGSHKWNMLSHSSNI